MSSAPTRKTAERRETPQASVKRCQALLIRGCQVTNEAYTRTAQLRVVEGEQLITDLERPSPAPPRSVAGAASNLAWAARSFPAWVSDDAGLAPPCLGPQEPVRLPR